MCETCILSVKCWPQGSYVEHLINEVIPDSRRNLIIMMETPKRLYPSSANFD